MLIEISHRLSFATGGGARALQHLLLSPLSGPTQTVKDWAIEMPGIETAARFLDAFGNRALLVSQVRPEPEMTVTVRGRVETHDRNGVLGRVPGEPVVALYRRTTALAAPDARLVEEFRGVDRHGRARIALYHSLMDRLAEARADGHAGQTQAQNGQAQRQGPPPGDADPVWLAHTFIGTVRALDLPARYVTGYLAAGEGQPASFHAWAEAYDDGLGWIGFDPALGVCPTESHVRVAAGLDALSIPPLRMAPAGGAVQLGEISVAAVAVQ